MKKNTATIIAAIIVATGTIVGTFCGNVMGKQSVVKQISSQIATINGDNNAVTFNNIDDLINSYMELQSENNSLKGKNDAYFSDVSSLKEQIENEEAGIKSISNELEDIPRVSFSNLGMCIDGENIPINSNDLKVTIDGRNYLAEDFLNNAISENESITIKDDILYIGQVISDAASLNSQRVMDSRSCDLGENNTDSYGNLHANSVKFYGTECHIIYNLNGKYSLFKCDLSIDENANLDKTGIITIKADDEVVYTSQPLTKTTDVIHVENVDIKNCALLRIEYSTKSNYNKCILSDAVVYN
ncbi:MAG: NPCBM/NEW2 domain-containing protein [Lachnospiraceae bacterium]|nr:NPCBM/NEW2 domain-containing protein [Lachnospiraceae bacterium]